MDPFQFTFEPATTFVPRTDMNHSTNVQGSFRIAAANNFDVDNDRISTQLKLPTKATAIIFRFYLKKLQEVLCAMFAAKHEILNTIGTDAHRLKPDLFKRISDCEGCRGSIQSNHETVSAFMCKYALLARARDYVRQNLK